MARMDDLEERIEAIERRQQEILSMLENLINESREAEREGISLWEAKTWEHPNQSLHVVRAVQEEVAESPGRFTDQRSVIKRVNDEHGHVKTKIKARIQTLIDEGILESRDGRIRMSHDMMDADEKRLFLSNVQRREAMDEFAEDRGHSRKY